jgi:FkbM family methyltransferase
MLETLHRLGSRLRNSKVLRRQAWLWGALEPLWQSAFGRWSRNTGYATHINDDVFRLEYAYGSRYDRQDMRTYEPTFYLPFVARIEPGMTVFDIGAHVGIFALGAAKRVGRTGRVVAFEPAPQTAAVLKRHVAFNGMRDRIRVEEAVVSDSEKPVAFFVYNDSMAASLSRVNVEDLNPEVRSASVLEVEVPSYTLDGYCRERKLTPQVIKLDVEGAEHRVLLGGRELLSQNDVTILCEVHPKQMVNCGGSLDGFLALVAQLGYEVEPLDEPNPLGTYHSLITRRGRGNTVQVESGASPVT